MEYYSRFFEKPEGSFFLFGARGTGKSTILKNNFPNPSILDLLEPDLYRKLQAKPELLSEMVGGNPKVKTWIIDEIQRVPDLLSLVHKLIEDDEQLKFVLTGSSARKLKQSGVDLLGGRALENHLFPYMAAELGDDFDLERSLKLGLLPLVWSSKTPEKTLDGYLSLYMQMEIQAEGLVRNLPAFSRFLTSISFSHGSILNYADIARDCGIDAKTVRNYVDILVDLLVASRVEVFSRRAKRELISANKFYFFDAGVFRSVRPRGPLDKPEEIAGMALEGLVFQHLQAWASYRDVGDKVYFWRSRSGVEVDFVVYGADEFTAIEVKHSDQIDKKSLRALHEFASDYPESKQIYIYRGKNRLQRDNILILPADDLFRGLHPAKHLKDCIAGL
jgi:predicted AAA+ superfamily ATPase